MEREKEGSRALSHFRFAESNMVPCAPVQQDLGPLNLNA